MSIEAQLSHGEKVRRTLMSIDLSVGGDRQILTRSRSGDRELQGPPCTAPLCRAGSPDPARTATKNPANLANLVNPAPNPAPNPANLAHPENPASKCS